MDMPLDASEVLVFRDQARMVLGMGLLGFYDNPVFSDLTVVLPSCKRLKCHQIILAACSRKFAAILASGEMANQELPVQGVDSDALESVLRFFYTSECAIMATNVVPLWDACSKLEVPGLAQACEDYLRKHMTVGSVALFLDHALQLSMEELVEMLLTFCRSHFAEVIDSNAFRSCSQATAMRMLKAARPTQSIESMLRAASNWLLADPRRMDGANAFLAALEIPATVVPAAPGGDGGMVTQQPAAQQVSAPQPLPAAQVPAPAAAPAAGGPPSQIQVIQPGGGVATIQILPNGVVSLPAGLAMQLEQGGGLQVQLPPGAAGPQGGVVGLQQLMAMLGGAQPAAAAAPAPVPAAVVAAPAVQMAPPGIPVTRAATAPAPSAGAVPLAGGGWAVLEPSQNNLAGLVARGPSDSTGGTPKDPSPVTAAGMQMRPRGARPTVALSPVPELSGAGGRGRGRGPTSGVAGGRGSGRGSASKARGRSSATWQDEDGSVLKLPAPPALRGVCHVDNCFADLTPLRDYHQRFRICDYHLKASSIMKDGMPQRFCQQCGRFHPLPEFDGLKRSCRARLQRHNARRRKKGEAVDNDTTAGMPIQQPPPHQRHVIQTMPLPQLGAGLALARARHSVEGLLSGPSGPMPPSAGLTGFQGVSYSMGDLPASAAGLMGGGAGGASPGRGLANTGARKRPRPNASSSRLLGSSGASASSLQAGRGGLRRPSDTGAGSIEGEDDMQEDGYMDDEDEMAAAARGLEAIAAAVQVEVLAAARMRTASELGMGGEGAQEDGGDGARAEGEGEDAMGGGAGGQGLDGSVSPTKAGSVGDNGDVAACMGADAACPTAMDASHGPEQLGAGGGTALAAVKQEAGTEEADGEVSGGMLPSNARLLELVGAGVGVGAPATLHGGAARMASGGGGAAGGGGVVSKGHTVELDLGDAPPPGSFPAADESRHGGNHFTSPASGVAAGPGLGKPLMFKTEPEAGCLAQGPATGAAPHSGASSSNTAVGALDAEVAVAH